MSYIFFVFFFVFRGKAPADTSANDDHLSKDFVCPLGLVPHQVSFLW